MWASPRNPIDQKPGHPRLATTIATHFHLRNLWGKFVENPQPVTVKTGRKKTQRTLVMLVQKCNYTCVLFVFLCWLSAWCWSEILRWSKFLRKFRNKNPKKSHLLLCIRSTNKIKAFRTGKPFWCRWDFWIFNLGKVTKIWRTLHWKTSPTNQPTPEGVRASG